MRYDALLEAETEAFARRLGAPPSLVLRSTVGGSVRVVDGGADPLEVARALQRTGERPVVLNLRVADTVRTALCQTLAGWGTPGHDEVFYSPAVPVFRGPGLELLAADEIWRCDFAYGSLETVGAVVAGMGNTVIVIIHGAGGVP